MPPKAKFTREEVTKAALGLTRRKGIGAVTARALGEELGSSARPIFTVFESMEELQGELVKAAKEIYKKYVEAGLKETPAFKGVGKAYIRFAAEEPRLFRLLFMREREQALEISRATELIDENYERILASVCTSYALGREAADVLYRHLWIFSHGIAVLLVTGVCSFTAEEISDMLTRTCRGILAGLKEEGEK